MDNPFEIIDRRLSNIENLLLDIKHGELNFPVRKKDEDELMTVPEVCKFLDLKRATIYGKVHKREIPYRKMKKRLYFSRKDLMEWTKKHSNDFQSK